MGSERPRRSRKRSPKRRIVVVRSDDESEDSPPTLLRYVTFDAEIGRFLIARSEAGLRFVTFEKNLDPERALARLTKGGRIMAVEDRLSLRRVVDDVRGYLSGERVDFDYQLDLRDVTEFNRGVLELARTIPYGTLKSYKWVAETIGSPRATRPVGQALAHNPLPVVVPCHRVVNSDGSLGGYSGGGPDMKRRLIGIEAGQMGFPLGESEGEVRRRVRFLLETDAPPIESDDEVDAAP